MATDTKSDMDLIVDFGAADDKVEDKLVDTKPAEQDVDADVPEQENEEKTEKKEEVEIDPTEDEINDPPANRPTVTDIKAKFPTLFKEFPELKHLLFREPEYTKIYPTIEDAKDASVKSEDYDQLVDQIGRGALSEIFTAMDEETINKTAQKFLPELMKHNEDLYFSIINPIIDNMLKHAFKDGTLNGNEDLQASAQWISQWLFGDAAFAKGEKSIPRPKIEASEDKKLKNEKKEFYDNKFLELKGGAVSEIKQTLSSSISEGLKDVTNLSVRSAIEAEVIKRIGDVLGADTIHIKQMEKLWERAESAGYPLTYKSRIVGVYLARAKALVPALRAKIKAEFVGSPNKSIIKDEEKETNSNLRPSGEATYIKGRIPNAKEVNWNETSDLEFLRGKATLKRR